MENHTLRPDSKGRINLGVVATNVSSYRATVEDSGKIILEPYMEIPFSEKWVFEDKGLLEKIKKQLSQEHVV